MERILGSHVTLTSASLVGPPQLDLDALMGKAKDVTFG